MSQILTANEHLHCEYKLYFNKVLGVTKYSVSRMEEDKIKQRILFAIRKGDHEKVGKILEAHSGQISPNAEADTAQNRLLHRAAR